MAEIVLSRLRRKFGADVKETHSEKGNETAVVAREALADIARFLRDDPELRFDMPIDCTAVDWLGHREVRFEVIYHLYSTSKKRRVRLKIEVPGEDAWVPSLTPVWPGMNWHERETWDMYGIRFKDHPNLKRVLMYDEFVGHPLRKDYPIDKRQPRVEMRPVTSVPTQREVGPDRLNKP